MDFMVNYFGQTEPSRIYLCRSDNSILYELNGIQEDSVEISKKLNNMYDLSCTVDKYVYTEDGLIESNGYNDLDAEMYLYVERVGYFRMTVPTVDNDGFHETKTITASSCDCELMTKSLVGFKVNCGTEDSLEYLVEGNVVEQPDGLKLPKEYIYLYNKDNPKLSLLDYMIEKVPNWSIGYVDPVINLATEIIDGIEQPVIIKRCFDIDSSNIYAFLTQDVAKAYQCVFIFDIIHRKINAYSVENLGKDSGVFISFRNLAQSVKIEEQTADSVYTRFNVAGAEDLNIDSVNFGNSYIEDLSYFMRLKYVNQELIDKYKSWQSYVEEQRTKYIEKATDYGTTLDKQTEVYYRVPNDGCETDWNTFSTEELNRLVETYTKMAEQLKESFYDESTQQWTNDAACRDYIAYTETIIPNIKITLENRGNSSDPFYEYKDNIDSWKTQWELYGVKELSVKLSTYEENAQALISYAKAWDELESSKQTSHGGNEESYNIYHNQWIECRRLISECTTALSERQAEYDTYTEQLKTLASERDNIAKSVNKSNFGFTDEEIKILSQLYNDSDYVNENILLVSTDDSTSTIDKQKQLLEAAFEQLSQENHPQYSFSTSMDNLFCIPEFKEWRKDFDTGNFIHLSVSDDDRYFVKLRITEISWNPCVLESDISVSFSNMITTKSKRNDFDTLLDGIISSAKNQISGKIKSTIDSSMITVSDAFIKSIVNSGALNNVIQNGVYDTITANKGVYGSIITQTLNANEIMGNSGMFQRVEASDGSFVDVITVAINADTIVTGTLAVERLLIRPTKEQLEQNPDIKSIILEINNIGELASAELSEEEANNYLINGKSLVAESVTARQIHAEAITADKLATDAITSRNGVTKLDLSNGVLHVGVSTESPDGALYFDGKDVYINGSGTFSGTIYATDGEFTGSITSKDGQIAGFTIKENQLYSNGHSSYNTQVDGIYLGTDYLSFGSGGKTYFKNDGTFSLGNGKLVFNGSKLSFGSDVTVSWEQVIGTEGVATTDQVTTIARTEISTASIKAGQIKTGSITSTDGSTTIINLDNGQFTFGGGKLSWNGSLLSVNGNVTTDYLQATGGKIASFKIQNGYLYNKPFGTVGSGSDSCGMSAGTDWGGNNDYIFWAGSGVYRVDINGNLYSQNSYITGNMELSGYITTRSYNATSNYTTACVMSSGAVRTYTKQGNDTSTVPGSDGWSFNSFYGSTDGGWLEFYGDSYNPFDIPVSISKNGINIHGKSVSIDGHSHSKIEATDGKTYAFAVKPYESTSNIITYINGTRDTGFMALGATNSRFSNIYLSNSPNVSSDKRLKEDFQYFNEDNEKAFMKLKPGKYRFKNIRPTDQHDRVHYGFQAQDVEEALSLIGLTSEDCAFLCIDKIDPLDQINPYEPYGITDDIYSLKYEEMIPWNTHMIQTTILHQERLEEKIVILESQIDFLKRELEILKAG